MQRLVFAVMKEEPQVLSTLLAAALLQIREFERGLKLAFDIFTITQIEKWELAWKRRRPLRPSVSPSISEQVQQAVHGRRQDSSGQRRPVLKRPSPPRPDAWPPRNLSHHLKS